MKEFAEEWVEGALPNLTYTSRAEEQTAASWDYAQYKSMLRRVKIFKLTINVRWNARLSEPNTGTGTAPPPPPARRPLQNAAALIADHHRIPQHINHAPIPSKYFAV